MQLFELREQDRFRFTRGQCFNHKVTFVLVAFSDDRLRARITPEGFLQMVNEEEIECSSTREVIKVS